MRTMNLNNYKLFYHIKLALIVSLLVASVPVPQASANPEGKDQTILLGQSCALSGLSEDIGKQMNAGIISALDQANVDGGVHGRQFKLIAKDDFYEPGQAIRNTKELIYQEKVFALIGAVGTPTARVVLPIAQKEKVPFITPFTGARFLRTPIKRYVINIRAGYDEETRKIISYLVENQKLTQIACFYQDDSFGLAGLQGVRAALETYGLTPVSEETYQRNTVAVMGGFLRIRQNAPQAVVLVGSYQPCAEFIKLARAKGMEQVIFATLSFSGTRSLIKALNNQTDNIIISQVMPSPQNRNIKIVDQYLKALAKFQPELEPSYISLEGYIAGRFFIEVIRQMDPDDISREKFIDTIEHKQTIKIDDFVMTFGPQDHQGLDATYLTHIRDGRIAPLVY